MNLSVPKSPLDRSAVWSWEDEDGPVPSVGDILRLLFCGATGAILQALGPRPLRTKSLTQRLPEYSPRTVYRYAGTLGDLQLVERSEEAGVPSRVTYSLTTPFGRELYALLSAFADGSAERHRDGGARWDRLGQLADFWESGMARELSFRPRSTTDLADAADGLTYHQAERRVRALAAAELLEEVPGQGRGVNYALSEAGRRAMALVAGVGRWRRRYVGPRSGTGLTPAETATVLRATLPLVRLPEHPGGTVGFAIAAEEGDGGGAIIPARVGPGGEMRCTVQNESRIDGWARGRVKTWLLALLKGKRGRMHVGGDAALVAATLSRLHDELWPTGHGDGPSPPPSRTDLRG